MFLIGGGGMKYALVLESNSETCNSTAELVASMGYLVTPVFSPKKALHAAHMIQFDLIVTCTASMPGDRRSLTGELARCSPDALLVLVAEPELKAVDKAVAGRFLGVNAIIDRPVIASDLQHAIDCRDEPIKQPLLPSLARERRRKAVV
jgi:CheY-like chemotaxis protein